MKMIAQAFSNISFLLILLPLVAHKVSSMATGEAGPGSQADLTADPCKPDLTCPHQGRHELTGECCCCERKTVGGVSYTKVEYPGKTVPENCLNDCVYERDGEEGRSRFCFAHGSLPVVCNDDLIEATTPVPMPMLGIYGGGPFYVKNYNDSDVEVNITYAINNVKQSGFTSLFPWAIHMSINGSISLEGIPLIKNGQYVGRTDWPGQLTQMMCSGGETESCINRIIFSIGGGGVHDFEHIQNLLKTKEGKQMLTDNFSALKAAFPMVNGFDFDNEENEDVNETVNLCVLLHKVGFREVTFNVYRSQDFWVEAYNKTNELLKGFVTGFNLQVYSGGAGNNPCTFFNAYPEIKEKNIVYPLICADTSDCGPDNYCPYKQPGSGNSVKDLVSQWKKECGIKGASMWLYDSIVKQEVQCQNTPNCSASGSTLDNICNRKGGAADYATAIYDALK